MNLDDADDLGLTDKVAIVSGGGALDDGVGNGRAAALLLARSGARVLLVDRNLEAAEGTVALIKKDGGATSAFAADVTNEDDCRNMVDAAMTQFGRLDFLDNNVGIGSRGSVVDEALETYRKVMRVNVESMFLTSKYAIPVMIASGGGGAIVNISSISALRPRGLTTYSVSKGAVITLSKAMAVDHGPDGIRVNCVAPGPVYTPMVYAHGMSESARGQRRDASLIGIEGMGWDIGNAVRFLLSNHARYITGQTLVVDGGATLRGPARDSH
ncbi:MAG: SDR family NAD(P)-dependent oxidoreductase [Alphaproteobacteria bacterium]|jgi:NAD(P)-dependent dehydrogenase (short-subunit alcohol dehydrogenase family)